jgi:hypothetical protein
MELEKMNTYRITEKQNQNSHRAGELIQAANLSAAKRIASRMQVFQGTIIEISSPNQSMPEDTDADTVLAHKLKGKWQDTGNI